MLKRIMRGIKGFTLIELLAVMAIVAVLAGIVSVAVTGTGQTSRDTQVQEDANTTGSAVVDYFDDQPVTEALTAQDVTVLGLAATEEKSNQWPEEFISSTYPTAFEDPSIVTVANITLLDTNGAVAINEDADVPSDVRETITVSSDGGTWTITDGTTTVTLDGSTTSGTLTVDSVGYTFTQDATTDVLTITLSSDGSSVGSLSPFTVDDLLEDFNALDSAALDNAGYSTTIPESGTATSTDNDYPNYLWLLEKDIATSSQDTVSSRNVSVYVLTQVEDPDNDGVFDLIFKRLV